MRRMPPPLAPTLVALAVLLAAATSTASDLTGKWRFEYGNTSAEFVDVIDVAGAISLTVSSVPGIPGEIPYSGTLAGSTLALTGTGCGPPSCSLNATVLFGESYFDGRFQEEFSVVRVLANRCECFDGNTADGDGCDATCRIEPCFTCAGIPSSCSPTADGGSCSDGSACTTADICTAGVCNGASVTPCVDLSGLWDTTEVSEVGPISERVVRIEQRDTFVLFRDGAAGNPRQFGTIIPATGVFSLAEPQLPIFCSGTDPLSGSAALDGQTFEASGSRGSVTILCAPLSYALTGTRQCPGTGCLPPAPTPALSPSGGIVLAVLLALVTAWLLRPSDA